MIKDIDRLDLLRYRDVLFAGQAHSDPFLIIGSFVDKDWIGRFAAVGNCDAIKGEEHGIARLQRLIIFELQMRMNHGR